MKTVKITKELMNGSGIRFNKRFISNGQWLIAKDLISNADDFKDRDTIIKLFPDAKTAFLGVANLIEEYIEEVMPEKGRSLKKFTKTSWLVDGFRSKAWQARKFVSNDGDDALFINELFVRAFKLETVFSIGVHTIVYTTDTEEDCNFAIMPMLLSWADNDIIMH